MRVVLIQPFSNLDTHEICWNSNFSSWMSSILNEDLGLLTIWCLKKELNIASERKLTIELNVNYLFVGL